MALDEGTPLLQTIGATPAPRRYPHHHVRMLFTVVLGFIFAVTLIVFSVPKNWLPHWSNDDLLIVQDQSKSFNFPFSELQDIFLTTPNPERIDTSARYYTAGPHLAGKNRSQALWTQEQWRAQGIPSELVSYDVYINYPLDHRLALLQVEEDQEISTASVRHGNKTRVLYECQLEEDELEDDPSSRQPNRVPAFHGYGAKGNVTAPYVFVNFGTYQDFDDLQQANIKLAGHIAVAKYGRNFRGLKVKRAQELGMVGVVMYDDPQEDGDITELNGYQPYPHGPARQRSSVQRGSVQYISSLPGDPTTPGYASKPGVPRTDPSSSTPQIPSLPISYREAIVLLKSLNGHGPLAEDLGKYWQGGALVSYGVKYNVGPSPSSLQLNLMTDHKYEITPIWSVIGTINGTASNEVVLIGNHRDAWISGGAGDPNSGSAVLNEVVHGIGIALSRGWRPLRTIVLASWDGEEYGLLGSTEWVEDHASWLNKTAVAYINVDVAAAGPKFHAAASPILKKIIRDAVDLVPDPNMGSTNKTIADHWDGQISTIGSGSDFTAFQDSIGIPSADLGFMPSKTSAVYHYHSNYDSLTWMQKYGDSLWHTHIAMSRLWGLILATLASKPILDFVASDYTSDLRKYLQAAQAKAQKSRDSQITRLSFNDSFSAIEELAQEAAKLDHRAHFLKSELAAHEPGNRRSFPREYAAEMKDVNTKYKFFERKFLYQQGLDNRSFFKHVVFAPGLWTGYSGATFPGLMESIDVQDAKNAKRWMRIIDARLKDAKIWLSSF